MYNKYYTLPNLFVYFLLYNLFVYLSMDIVEYLKAQSAVNLKYLADKMWENNPNANIYLSMKLSGKRPWTKIDDERMRGFLKELGIELVKVSKDRKK